MKRIVIRLNKEEFETLKLFKSLTNLSWRDILLGGFAFWYEKLDFESKVSRLKETFKVLEEEKN